MHMNSTADATWFDRVVEIGVCPGVQLHGIYWIKDNDSLELLPLFGLPIVIADAENLGYVCCFLPKEGVEARITDQTAFHKKSADTANDWVFLELSTTKHFVDFELYYDE